MKTGTKSILFGAHCFFIHPFYVAAAWKRLYGRDVSDLPPVKLGRREFHWSPLKQFALSCAFFLHDLGYWGKEKMDDEEGERHVEWAARLMTKLFDGRVTADWERLIVRREGEPTWSVGEWGRLCLFHSRFYAKKHGCQFSKLCVADKLSIVLTPAWLYLPMVNWSGEIHEYMKLADSCHDAGEPRFEGKYVGMNTYSPDQARWFANVQEYLRRWVDEHKDLRPDTWTPAQVRP